MNLLIVLLIMILGVFFITISQRLFEKNSILNTYMIYDIISFLLTFKILQIFKISINTSIITSSIFSLLTYLILEKSTLKEYKKIITKTFIINISISLLLLLNALYINSITDITSPELKNIFLDNYKIIISYPIITLIVQLVTFLIYNNIGKEINNINLKIILTNLNVYIIESFLIVIFSYIFKFSYKEIFNLIINNYLFKTIISLIYLPAITYLVNKKKVTL